MLTKSRSLPSKLNYFDSIIPKVQSFYNFEQLHLKGRQTLLTFGQYSAIKGSKKNRRKIIHYVYSNL